MIHQIKNINKKINLLLNKCIIGMVFILIIDTNINDIKEDIINSKSDTKNYMKPYIE